MRACSALSGCSWLLSGLGSDLPFAYSYALLNKRLVLNKTTPVPVLNPNWDTPGTPLITSPPYLSVHLPPLEKSFRCLLLLLNQLPAHNKKKHFLPADSSLTMAENPPITRFTCTSTGQLPEHSGVTPNTPALQQTHRGVLKYQPRRKLHCLQEVQPVFGYHHSQGIRSKAVSRAQQDTCPCLEKLQALMGGGRH